MENLKLIKENIKNGFWDYEAIKKEYIERSKDVQKDLLGKIKRINELNELTCNFNTDLINEYMENFLEIEKIKRYFKIK